MSSKKGQVVSYDFIISISFFFLILGFLLFYFYYYSSRTDDIREKNFMNDLAQRVSNIFFDEGNPIYWNENNFLRIGLANNGKINNTKLEILKNISYQKFLNSFKSGIFYIKLEIYNKSESLIYEYPNIGVSGKDIIKLERFFILNESFGKGVVYVFKK